MSRISISSRDNPRVKNVVKLLNSAKARREQSLFVAEGMRLCGDVFQSRISVESLFYTDQAVKRYGAKLQELITAAKDAFLTEQEVFDRMSDTAAPQGVLAVCRIPDAAKFQTSIRAGGRYLALEKVGDPSNLGAAARTAEAFGVDGMILGESGCDPFSPKALRASMGALVRIPVIICGDFCASLSQLKSDGFRLLAAVVKGGKPLTGVAFKDGDIVMVGNEADGLSDKAVGISDEKITIPMTGRAESLNAAAAAAVIVWEMTKGGRNG